MINAEKLELVDEKLAKKVQFTQRSRLLLPFIQTKSIWFINFIKMHRRAQTRTTQDDSTNASQPNNPNKALLPRKSGKPINKGDKPKKINSAEWTIFEKCTYARLLMQFIMHHLQVDDYFYEICAHKTGRTSREIYAFHAKMTALYRYPQGIVVKLLGCKLTSPATSNNIREDNLEKDIPEEDSINLKQVYLDSNQWSLDSAQVNFLSTLIISDACPDTSDPNQHSQVFEMNDDECQKSLQLTHESSIDYNPPASVFSAADYLQYDYY